jgi:methane/ammonia monooxygenase subunit B
MTTSLASIGRATRWLAALLLLCEFAPLAFAHGERNQEPFLRMRTAHFYDMQWSTTKLAVNDTIVVTGKFRLSNDWPGNLPPPEVAFLGNGTPGPVLTRIESYINGQAAIQSTKLVVDRDYDFKTVMKARIPGKHHVHPMINVSGAGPLLGPGNFIEITGNKADFKLPLTTIDGTQIDNLETWGVANVVGWHLLWAALGVFWLLWWLRRPMLMPRLAAVDAGHDDLLVTPTDKKVAAGLLIVTLLIVVIGFNWASAKYPRTVPLQGGQAKIDPLPLMEAKMEVRVERATYDVPGRSMKLRLKVHNTGTKPVQLGEFTTAALRFVNRSVPAAMAGISANYPLDLVPKSGLVLPDNAPIAPGETRVIEVHATDVAWERERLTNLINDPDNRMGGLLFFFDPDGKRTIANISGPIVPVFTRDGA